MVSRLEAKIHEPVGQLHRTTRSGLKSKIQWFLMIFKGDFSIYVYYVMYIYIYILCSLTLFCPTNVCPLASKYGSRTFLSEWNSHDFMIWIWIYIYRLGIFRCLVRLKDQKLRFASTVSTHSPNMLWAWLAENGFCFFLGFPWRISISKPIMTLNSHTSSDILEHVGACRIASMNLLCLRWHTSDLPRCGTGLFEHRIAGWVLEVHPCWQTPCMSSWESCWCSSSIALNPTKSHSASH
jgi:hypothetical protein